MMVFVLREVGFWQALALLLWPPARQQLRQEANAIAATAVSCSAAASLAPARAYIEYAFHVSLVSTLP